MVSNKYWGIICERAAENATVTSGYSANAIEYIETCIEKGLKVDDFAPRLSFFFAVPWSFLRGSEFEQLARRIYAKIMRERFHAKNAKSWHLRFHVQTSRPIINCSTS